MKRTIIISLSLLDYYTGRERVTQYVQKKTLSFFEKLEFGPYDKVYFEAKHCLLLKFPCPKEENLLRSVCRKNYIYIYVSYLNKILNRNLPKMNISLTY